MDGKRKKIADVEAEWEEKMITFSSQIEGLQHRIVELEERLLKLENPPGKSQGFHNSFVLFSKEKVYPVMQKYGSLLGKKTIDALSWAYTGAKEKCRIAGYAKTALFSGLFLGILLFFCFYPWTNRPQEQKDMKNIPHSEHSIDSSSENKYFSRTQEETKFSERENLESNMQPASQSKEEERNDLPLITTLIEKSQQGDTSNRIQAIEALGKLNSPSANHQLCKLMKDSNADIRWYSLRTLGNTRGDRASLLALFAIVQDKQDSIEYRREAMRSLANLGSKFVEFTASEKKALLDILLDTSLDEELRANSAYALSTIGYASISSRITPLLKDPSSLVREMVAYTLGSFSYPNADKELIELMKSDESIQVRLAAVQALSKINIKVGSIAPELFDQWKKETEDCVKKELKDSLKKLSRISGFPVEVREKMGKYIKD